MNNYLETCAAIAQSNPAKPEPIVAEPAIKAGAHFRRNSDGKPCVVCRVGEPADGLLRYRYECGVRYTGDADWFADHHTHAYTPADDLSNLKDGDKLIDMESGEVVTVQAKGSDRFVQDSDDRLHGVNGLPAQSTELGDDVMLGWWLRDEYHCATGAADRYADDRETFYLHDKFYTPEDWAREIVTNDEYDASKVLPEYQHLIEAAEAEAKDVDAPKGPCSVRVREGKKWGAELWHSDHATPFAKIRLVDDAREIADLVNADIARRQLESEVRDGE